MRPRYRIERDYRLGLADTPRATFRVTLAYHLANIVAGVIELTLTFAILGGVGAAIWMIVKK